jgi:hypothetical protein
MSKYQELYKAFVTDMSRHYENTNDCLNFAHQLVLKMVYKLGWDESVEYMALQSTINSTNSSNSSTSISLYPEDKSKEQLGKLAYIVDENFWYFGVRLKLRCGEIAGRHKEVKFIIPFFIKKDDKDNKFVVKIDKNGQEYRYRGVEEFNELYDLVFERLKEVIELGVQRLLERGEHSKNFQQKGIVISLKELDELKKITN